MTLFYLVLLIVCVSVVVGWIAWSCGYAAAKADRAEDEAQADLASRQSNANRWGTQ